MDLCLYRQAEDILRLSGSDSPAQSVLVWAAVEWVSVYQGRV